MTIMNSNSLLTNQLLIAMPGMKDPNFESTVTLICEHTREGALGIIINRPLSLKLSDLFKELSFAKIDPTTAKQPVLDGGPIESKRGFVLHNKDHFFENTFCIHGFGAVRL